MKAIGTENDHILPPPELAPRSQDRTQHDCLKDLNPLCLISLPRSHLELHTVYWALSRVSWTRVHHWLSQAPSLERDVDSVAAPGRTPGSSVAYCCSTQRLQTFDPTEWINTQVSQECYGLDAAAACMSCAVHAAEGRGSPARPKRPLHPLLSNGVGGMTAELPGNVMTELQNWICPPQN